MDFRREMRLGTRREKNGAVALMFWEGLGLAVAGGRDATAIVLRAA